MNFLTLSLAALSILLSAGGLWMAIWAWRTFRVSIFAWLVGGRILGGAASWVTMTPDSAKFDAAIEVLQTQSNLSPMEFFVSSTYGTLLFPILSMLGFGLIALGELSHFGRFIAPAYQAHWALDVVYRLRHLFGVFAVTCVLVPSTAVYVWIRSMP